MIIIKKYNQLGITINGISEMVSNELCNMNDEV